MKIYELISFTEEQFRRMAELGIRPDDYQYIDLFRDYTKMIADGCKVTYTVATLADRYGICERKIYTLLKRFKSECNSLIIGGGGNSWPT